MRHDLSKYDSDDSIWVHALKDIKFVRNKKRDLMEDVENLSGVTIEAQVVR